MSIPGPAGPCPGNAEELHPAPAALTQAQATPSPRASRSGPPRPSWTGPVPGASPGGGARPGEGPGRGPPPPPPARCRARPARLHPLPAAAGRRRRGPRPQQLPPPSPGTPLLTLKRAKTGCGGGLISDATSVTTFWTRHTRELLTLTPPVKPLQFILLPTRARSTPPAGRRFSFCLDSPSGRAAAPAVPDQRHCFCSHNCCRLLAFVTKCSLLGTPQAQNQCDLLNLKAQSSVKEQTSCHQTEPVHFGTTAFTSTKTKPPPRHLQCPRCSAASEQDPRSFQKPNRATNVSKRAREMVMNLFPGELTLIT